MNGSETIKQAITAARRRIKGCKGQLVLLAEMVEVEGGYKKYAMGTSGLMPDSPRVETHVSMGVLTRETIRGLSDTQYFYTLPVGRYVEYKSDNISGHCRLVDGAITLERLYNVRVVDGELVLPFEIVAGDAAVARWFLEGDPSTIASRLILSSQREKRLKVLWEMAHLLGETQRILHIVPELKDMLASWRADLVKQLRWSYLSYITTCYRDNRPLGLSDRDAMVLRGKRWELLVGSLCEAKILEIETNEIVVEPVSISDILREFSSKKQQ